MKKYFLAVLILLGGFSSASALTVSSMQTFIRQGMRDTSSSATRQRYSDAVLLTYINEAQKEISNLTWCLEVSTSYVLTAQTTYYALPTDYLSMKLVTFRDQTGTTVELEEYSDRKEISRNPNFENSGTGAPNRYFVRIDPDGNDTYEIAYVPVPTTTSTGTVTDTYYAQPSDLSAGTDVPFNGLNHLYPYHYTIVYNVLIRLKLQEALTNEAQVYQGLYDKSIAIMNNSIGKRPNYTPNITPAPR